ncbi:YggS family pyridoxal phosphate-dependent enzyme [Roseiconus nitratireducens]|uniref:Pyridoxal phosphate homeostasis protein n=1 Tax=Roseiconus nitratireducens TaxID=2605748 RepID=A0A5M6DJP5_9BACT|nr:YggS family pyridoxal phosphate-dependent enzyme [Roseiconus nitratireducens]KAA5545515.1 YggS family pyridoxal phosphate-dependent enzyme [Roseiconus nitratireducens]
MSTSNPESDNLAFERIRSNWQHVVREVTDAARQSGRDPGSVRIIGVSKYVGVEQTAMLVQAGCHDLAESRPQALWQKADALPQKPPIAWHMIGHVQTNKLRRLLRYRPLIHSVDSERLLRAIDRESKREDRVSEVLMEVNISEDPNKTGLSITETRSLLELDDLASVRIVGLMAMAGWGTDAEQAADQFRAVAALRDQIQAESGRQLPELSMGMSGDFREAIAAGATMVRIGSALFEGVR